MWTYCSDINAIFYRILPTFSDIYQNLLSELRAALRAAPTFLYQSMSGASRRPYFSISELRAALRAAPTFLYQSMSGASRRPYFSISEYERRFAPPYFSTLYPEKLPQDPSKGSAKRCPYPHSLSREIASR
jgi:hypothetical protein